MLELRSTVLGGLDKPRYQLAAKVELAFGLLMVAVLSSSAFAQGEVFPPDTKQVHSPVIRDSLHSRALDKTMGLNIYLPPGYSSQIKYPVLYILHGYTGHQDSWPKVLGVDQVVADFIAQGRIRPVIMVTLQLDNSYGINSAAEARRLGDDPIYSPNQGMYEDYVRDDIIPYIDARYSTITAPWGRAIGGDSMGGFAALHIAFRNQGLFSRVGGFQTAVFVKGSAADMESFLYPNEAARQERDPLELARTRDLSGLEIYLDCGEEDELKHGGQALYEILQERGVPSVFHLTSGGHTVERLLAHVEEYVLFLAGK